MALLARAPVRRSLLRQITWLGGDRRLVGFVGLLLFCVTWTMIMGLGMMFGLTLITPLCLFVVVLWVGRQAFQADPFMIDVVIRQFKYRKYYAAKPDLGTEHPQVRDFN